MSNYFKDTCIKIEPGTISWLNPWAFFPLLLSTVGIILTLEVRKPFLRLYPLYLLFPDNRCTWNSFCCAEAEDKKQNIFPTLLCHRLRELMVWWPADCLIDTLTFLATLNIIPDINFASRPQNSRQISKHWLLISCAHKACNVQAF